MFNRKFDLTEGVVNYRQPPMCRYTLVMFALVYIISEIFMYIPAVIYTFFSTFKSIADIMGSYSYNSAEYFAEVMRIIEDAVSGASYAVFSLFNTVFIILVVVIYCKFIEKRTVASLGIKFDRTFLSYFIGLIIGLVMISASVFISRAGGAVSFDGYANPRIYVVILFFLGYIVQGAAEEILFRGFFMVSFGARHGMTSGVLVSSLLFAMMHMNNTGFGVLPFINIFLFGVFSALIVISTDSIWCAAAIHSVWNFAQGHIYGLSVSGKSVFDSVFTFSAVGNHSIISGGAFGPEGGLAVTATLLVSIALFMLYTKGKDAQSGKTV